MLFRVSSPNIVRLVRAADPEFPTALDVTPPSPLPFSWETKYPAIAAGLRVAVVPTPTIDIIDPLEIAYLLSPDLGGSFAKPAMQIANGRIFYLASDGVTQIDPATLTAVDTMVLRGYTVHGTVGAGAMTGGYAQPVKGYLGDRVLDATPVAFPHWFNIS